ncbi:hypothetical protein AB0A95_32025 [Micromonospora sp. NPDC049230]|uniref:hypothetical protein n=1 Tax=Micromonospora sp. NPDC049230 TaxID=3155502 RepID=UPI0033DF957B
MEPTNAEPSEVSLGYDIFAPLWGLLQLGAAREWDGTSAFRPVFLAFVTARRDSLARLLAGIQAVGDLSPRSSAWTLSRIWRLRSLHGGSRICPRPGIHTRT